MTAVSLLSLLQLAAPAPHEPVIGVLTYPSHDAVRPGCQHDCGPLIKDSSYFGSSYARWLEQAGARVVPILYDSTPAELRAQFAKLNGVLFTGGPSKPTLAPAPYFATATALYDMVVAAHRKSTLRGDKVLESDGVGIALMISSMSEKGPAEEQERRALVISNFTRTFLQKEQLASHILTGELTLEDGVTLLAKPPVETGATAPHPSLGTRS